MARIILLTLFLFNLVIVPSIAFPFDFRFGFRFNGNNQEERDIQQEEQQPPENNDDVDEFLKKKNDDDVDEEKVKPKVAFDNGNLKEGFYSKTCPNAEKIVADALADIVKTNPNAPASLLRLQFHDCFVLGCDASILLDNTPTGDNVEKSSMLNGQLLKGTDVIDDIKAKLEEQCPGVVSCSDTLAFAVNEGMFISGLPRRAPLGGRRDAVKSLANVAEDGNLPMPNWSMEKMVDLFIKKGFTIEEMVILLGAHSIGSTHCDIFMERVYNFANTRKPDPVLPIPVVDELQQICKNPNTPQFRNPLVNFDETPTVLDNLFFKNMVTKKKTILITDAHLINDPRTIPIVQKMATENGLFEKRFADVMVKLSSFNVLTGNDGEVRKTCRATN